MPHDESNTFDWQPHVATNHRIRHENRSAWNIEDDLTWAESDFRVPNKRVIVLARLVCLSVALDCALAYLIFRL